MNSFQMIATPLFLLTSFVPVQASEHTGYWRQDTPEGAVSRCEGVSTQDRMQAVLLQAGWDLNQGLPQIDWERDTAVIVAPSRYYKCGRMEFYGLALEDDTVALQYGWGPLQPLPVGKTVRDASCTGSPDSTMSGRAATIVVAYRKDLESGRRFVCKDRGLTD